MSSLIQYQGYMSTNVDEDKKLACVLSEYTPLPTCMIEEILSYVTCPGCLQDDTELYQYDDTMLCLLCIKLSECPICGDISEIYGKVCISCMNDSKCNQWDFE